MVDHDFGTFFLQFFFEPCVCIFYALSPTIFLVIFFTPYFLPFSGQISGHIFGQIFGKLDTHQKLQNAFKKMWGMVRWEDFATYSARKLQNLAILPWSAKYTQPFFFRIRIVNFSYPKYWLVVAFSI